MTNDSLEQRLRSTLGTSYVLQRELGGGGMSRVFLVRDTTLERDIVVKVLAPDLAAGVSAERFMREIKLAAGLQQANIVPLLAAGETDGLPYYTMPFVDGLSLRARLERNGALPVGEAVAVLRDVARALAYAHEHGVVHRDIKPENVLLSGDAAVVTDFGIAKAVSASRTTAAGSSLTQVGTSVGTPAYMAPEQAAGDPDTDHRADIYALGCVAYEVLSGAAPFAHRAPHQLFAAHMNELPASLASRRHDVPHNLAALVMRCLKKDPADRPQSAREVLKTLDAPTLISTTDSGGSRESVAGRRSAVLGVVALLIVAAIAGGWALHRRYAATDAETQAATSAAAAAAAHSIAVLPFENRGDSADAYFADGITDAVRGKLTDIPGVTVIARASSNTFRGKNTTPDLIAHQLGVRYLLTGTVRFAGTGSARRMQVSPELVEVTNNGHPPTSRWQHPFDAAVKDVFAVQSDIASRVASAMQVAIGASAQARLAQVPTHDPAAYDAYLRGQAIYHPGVDPATLRRAIAEFEDAIRHDSTMVIAWAALSTSSSDLYFESSPFPVLARKALDAAERAIALDSTRWEGYDALAQYHLAIKRDLSQAATAIARARQVAPQAIGPRATAARLEAERGDLEAAVRDLAEISRLDPRNVEVWFVNGYNLLRLHRIPEARAAADRALALAPTNIAAIECRVLAEVASGDVPAARQVIARATSDVPREKIVAYLAMFSDLGWLLDADDARLLLTLSPETFGGDRSTMAIVRAEQYGWSGDMAQARAWGDTAARYFAVNLRTTPSDPQQHVMRGLALAYAGHSREALTEVERGLALQGPTAEARQSLFYAYFSYVAARTALVAGDRDRALAWLSDARRYHYLVTPEWLRADPTWTAIRGDPRFAPLTTAQ
ncbi:MAG: protein kinase [bacterium]